MSRISRDNCCTRIERLATPSYFADVTMRFEGYGFTLDYEGSDGEYLEEFEPMLKMFTEKVIKSYREQTNFNSYESCFDAMVEDFETHTCPFGTLVVGSAHF